MQKGRILFFLMICIAGGLFGLGMGRLLTPDPAVLRRAAAERQTQAPAITPGPTVGPDSRLVIRYSYNGCGHSELSEQPLPASWKGKEAAKQKISGAVFDSMEQNTLYFAKISQGKCSKHFRVYAEGNQLITVYQNDPSRIRDSRPFRPQLLSAEEAERLQAGIFIESEEELTSLLEDYCS